MAQWKSLSLYKLPHFHDDYVLFVIVSLLFQSLLLKSPTPTPWVVACMWHCEQMEGQRKILNHVLFYVPKVLPLQACSETAFCVVSWFTPSFFCITLRGT